MMSWRLVKSKHIAWGFLSFLTHYTSYIYLVSDGIYCPQSIVWEKRQILSIQCWASNKGIYCCNLRMSLSITIISLNTSFLTESLAINLSCEGRGKHCPSRAEHQRREFTATICACPLFMHGVVMDRTRDLQVYHWATKVVYLVIENG